LPNRTRNLLLLFCFLLHLAAPVVVYSEITPFRTANQSPLVQIYGLPRDTGADIIPPGSFLINLNQDTSSNYTVNFDDNEQITVDGETSRTVFAMRYGLAPNWEIGIEIPYIKQDGGFLDSFIIDWHDTFGLPQGGRTTVSNNRLNYSYSKDGVEKLHLSQAASGIGDVALTAGFRLYDFSASKRHDRLAIKAAVKLPTGDSSALLGSGSTDLSLQLCGSILRGTVGMFGSVGALAMSRGDVLRDQHNLFAGVGTLGIGWEPASWVVFKTQLSANTPFYRNSSLVEVSHNSLILIIGGTLKFPGDFLLDIGVTEDLEVATSPDVSFHLGLSKRF